MMLVTLVPIEVTTFLQSRRGSNAFRRVKIPPNTREIDYNALPSCALELVDITGHIWGRADILENRGAILLNYLGPPKPKFNNTEYMKAEKRKKIEIHKKEEMKLATEVSVVIEKVEEHDNHEGTISSKIDSRPKKKDNDSMQQVGRKRSDDGNAL